VEEKFRQVLQTVLGRIVPSVEERQATDRTTEEVLSRVQKALEEESVQGAVEVGGSVAKDTWLRDDVEIDFFILFPADVDRETLKRTGLRVAHKALAGCKTRERYAEHPYLEGWVNGIRVNIVPCYKATEKQWLSSADRSPYHTRYVQGKLGENPNLANEIKLLKRFLKGTNVYGAEIRIGGFSGYLCELLIINYGTFLSSLRAFAQWRFGEILDIERLHHGRTDEMQRLFQTPLIVVDPVDSNRNVAAAVTRERMTELIAASRFFLERPVEEFFYPQKAAVDLDVLREKFSSSELDVIAVVMRNEEKIPDILWGELGRTARALVNLLETNGFTVLRAEHWSDEAEISAIIITLESARIPPTRKHLGPPGDSRETTPFLEKYRTKGTIGPWVEKGRWVVGARRRYADAMTLLRERLDGGGQGIGVSTELIEVLRSSRLLVGPHVLDVSSSEAFRRFLARFIEGRPPWLAYSSSPSSCTSS